ncbi:UNVERIFIED_CONTAM: hypothetical protein GTU68_018086, partial [Idotea baltica]|nr:hypothetical protein [Idotea baltica]
FIVEQKLLTVGISIGDLNGIGVEIILKAFDDRRMFERCIPIIYGAEAVVNKHSELIKINIPTKKITTPEEAEAGVLNVIDCWNDTVNIKLGKEDKTLGKYAFFALEAVAKDALENKIDAIVTAPVSKELINTDSHKFVGQTEFFTTAANISESLMLMASEGLKVGLVTNHLPVAEVAEAISVNKIVRKLLVLNKGLITSFNIQKPRIAVLSLNPHAGDGGVIGNEENDILIPAIAAAKGEGVMAVGPFAADAFFGTGNYQKYDAVLAMFHDQGLIPFKALTFGSGTNVTLGLPFVRTSPDHGPAFDIAGANKADASSFREAIYTAVDIAQNRSVHTEIHKNPIKRMSFDDLKKMQKEDYRR